MELAQPQPYRFTREEYHRLGEVGILGENDRIELVDGELIVMSPIGRQHAKSVRKSNNLIVQRLAGRALVDCQNALNLNPTSEPQPDFLILRSQMADSDDLPTPADVLLIIESADSSLGFDRGKKLRLYAQAGVPEVWIYNLLESVIECYRAPEEQVYRDVHHFAKGQQLSMQAFPEVLFAVDELLP
jgi:Uma2 family endonuclease